MPQLPAHRACATDAWREPLGRLYVTGIRVLAERQIGEFLRTMPKQTGGHAMKARSEPSTEVTATLKDIGITKDQSSRAQRLADIPLSVEI
jgi:hypothetical protein